MGQGRGRYGTGTGASKQGRGRYGAGTGASKQGRGRYRTGTGAWDRVGGGTGQGQVHGTG